MTMKEKTKRRQQANTFCAYSKTLETLRGFHIVVMARCGSWVAAHNGLLRSIIFLSFRTPGTLTFITSLSLRAQRRFDFRVWFSPGFLMQKMTDLREPSQSDSSLALILLWHF